MEDPEAQRTLEQARKQLGTTVLGRFRLESVVGQGGLGVVYRALDQETGLSVAVKIVRREIARHPSIVARFLREARIAMALSHPAIPRGLATGTDAAGAPLLVMEYVAGVDLATLVETAGPLPVQVGLALGACVAEALAAAHQAGVIHRDIKPDNLMLCDGGVIPDGVRVLDFGIAFCLDEPRLTMTRTTFGSAEYMAPEQTQGRPVGAAADVYALGATLAHLLTGRTLYEGHAMEQMTAHCFDPPPSLHARRPEIPVLVDDYLAALLAKDPVDRPTSARDVADALRALARWCGDPARPRPRTTRPSDPRADPKLDPREGPGDAPRDVLIARLRAATERMHREMEAAASAQARVVEALTTLSARRLERSGLELERVQLATAGRAQPFVEVCKRLAELGDAEEARAREAALEHALWNQHRRARTVQDELLAEIRRLEAEIRALPD